MPIVRLGWPVAIAMVPVVVSFALSLAYSHLRLRPVSEQVVDVIDNAAPSIARLSTAHTELSRFGIGVAEYALRPVRDRGVTRRDIASARQAFAAHFAAYKQLPVFPGEADAVAAFERDLAQLDDAANQVLDGADRRSPAAERELHRSFYPRLFKLEMGLAGLKAINARYARISAQSTLRATREANFLAMVLGVSSLIVAVVAMVFMVRVLRGRARLMQEHAELLAARANELEAFAGRVAHDLKNPLGALALRVLSTGKRPELNPAVHDDLDRMIRQIDRMHRTIDGLLEFARAGAYPRHDARADLGEVLDEVASELRPAAEAAGAELRLETAPVQLACAKAALNSILSNLLGNAVKHIALGKQTPRRIIVRVKDRGSCARVEVEDNGPGLPPGSEQRAFEPFRRLMPESDLPGIGLGLATVKKIVEAYGGQVGVESRSNHGSTFWFELPKPAIEERVLPDVIGRSEREPPRPSA